jgi:nucleoid-associated protein YgaU
VTADQVEEIYAVSSGDTLTSIARVKLGDGSRWREILELNQDVIKSPSLLRIGQKLKIPKRE